MSNTKSKLSLNLLHKLFIFSEPYNNTCVKKALMVSRLKCSWVGLFFPFTGHLATAHFSQINSAICRF